MFHMSHVSSFVLSTKCPRIKLWYFLAAFAASCTISGAYVVTAAPIRDTPLVIATAARNAALLASSGVEDVLLMPPWYVNGMIDDDAMDVETPEVEFRAIPGAGALPSGPLVAVIPKDLKNDDPIGSLPGLLPVDFSPTASQPTDMESISVAGAREESASQLASKADQIDIPIESAGVENEQVGPRQGSGIYKVAATQELSGEVIDSVTEHLTVDPVAIAQQEITPAIGVSTPKPNKDSTITQTDTLTDIEMYEALAEAAALQSWISLDLEDSSEVQGNAAAETNPDNQQSALKDQANTTVVDNLKIEDSEISEALKRHAALQSMTGLGLEYSSEIQDNDTAVTHTVFEANTLKNQLDHTTVVDDLEIEDSNISETLERDPALQSMTGSGLEYSSEVQDNDTADTHPVYEANTMKNQLDDTTVVDDLEIEDSDISETLESDPALQSMTSLGLEYSSEVRDNVAVATLPDNEPNTLQDEIDNTTFVDGHLKNEQVEMVTPPNEDAVASAILKNSTSEDTVRNEAESSKEIVELLPVENGQIGFDMQERVEAGKSLTAVEKPVEENSEVERNSPEKMSSDNGVPIGAVFAPGAVEESPVMASENATENDIFTNAVASPFSVSSLEDSVDVPVVESEHQVDNSDTAPVAATVPKSPFSAEQLMQLVMLVAEAESEEQKLETAPEDANRRIAEETSTEFNETEKAEETPSVVSETAEEENALVKKMAVDESTEAKEATMIVGTDGSRIVSSDSAVENVVDGTDKDVPVTDSAESSIVWIRSDDLVPEVSLPIFAPEDMNEPAAHENAKPEEVAAASVNGAISNPAPMESGHANETSAADQQMDNSAEAVVVDNVSKQLPQEEESAEQVAGAPSRQPDAPRIDETAPLFDYQSMDNPHAVAVAKPLGDDAEQQSVPAMKTDQLRHDPLYVLPEVNDNSQFDAAGFSELHTPNDNNQFDVAGFSELHTPTIPVTLANVESQTVSDRWDTSLGTAHVYLAESHYPSDSTDVASVNSAQSHPIVSLAAFEEPRQPGSVADTRPSDENLNTLLSSDEGAPADVKATAVPEENLESLPPVSFEQMAGFFVTDVQPTPAAEPSGFLPVLPEASPDASPPFAGFSFFTPTLQGATGGPAVSLPPVTLEAPVDVISVPHSAMAGDDQLNASESVDQIGEAPAVQPTVDELVPSLPSVPPVNDEASSALKHVTSMGTLKIAVCVLVAAMTV
eukprot:GHVT01070468.1.p1 GENE.GHVT01070468.1~~GHVT01070468.1.p1  ORF type:complete len:1217 (+),score=229.71 GHVT01070468.1:2821-6471(+)